MNDFFHAQTSATIFEQTRDTETMKKKLFVFWVVCLCLLSACSARQETQGENVQTPPEVSSAVQIDVRNLPDGQCYRQTTWPLPEGITQAEGQCIWDGRIYSYSNVSLALGLTGASGSATALPLPDAEYLYGVCRTGDALALLAGTYPAFYFDADGEPVTVDAPEGRYSITTYDVDGAILSTVPLAEVYPEEPRGFDGGSGAYYLLFAERVVKIGADGQQLAEQAAFDGQLLQILATPDAVYVRVEGDTLYETGKVVRLNAETLQAEAEFSCAALDVHGMGLGVDGRLLLVNQEYLLQPDFETGTVAAVLSWKDNANTAANNYQTVLGTDEGFFALNSSIEAACFYERLPDGETLAEPTEITLYQAAFNDLPLTVYASEFQKLYPQYRVTVIEAKSTEEKELALTELGTGKGYDIYLLSETQWQQLRDADVFEDLLPWMNADSSAPLDVMRTSIRQTLTKSGNLYRLPVGYRISTYVVDPDRLETFTPEAVLATCTSSDVPLYPFIANSAGEDGFDYTPSMAALCAQDYVDTAQASCSFDSDSFKAQLQLLKLQEAAKAEPYPCNGLLYLDVITNVETIAYDAERYLLPPMEQYVFCGYPSDHANGSVLHFSELFAINANSKQKSGAWAFLSYLLTQPCQESMQLRLPVNDSVLQVQLTGLLEKETITQHEIDMFYQLVDSLQAADYPTATVEQIIREELAPYLAGDTSEEEATQKIQSRVYLYLQEQYQ